MLMFWLVWFPMMLSAYLGVGMFAGRLTWNRIQLASAKKNKTVRYSSRSDVRDEPNAEDKFFIVMCTLFPMIALPVHGLINLAEYVAKRPTPEQKKYAKAEEAKELKKISDELNDELNAKYSAEFKDPGTELVRHLPDSRDVVHGDTWQMRPGSEAWVAEQIAKMARPMRHSDHEDYYYDRYED